MDPSSECENCPICQEELSAANDKDEIETLPCGHRVHLRCAWDCARHGRMQCSLCGHLAISIPSEEFNNIRYDQYYNENMRRFNSCVRKAQRAGKRADAPKRLISLLSKYENQKKKYDDERAIRKEEERIFKKVKSELSAAHNVLKSLYEKDNERQKLTILQKTRTNIEYKPKRHKELLRKSSIRRTKHKMATYMGFRWIHCPDDV